MSHARTPEQWAEEALNNSLTPAEQQMLAARLASGGAFRAEYEEAEAVLRILGQQARSAQFRETLHGIHNARKTATTTPQPRRTLSMLKAWRTVAVAASVAALVSIAGMLATTGRKPSTQQYGQLKREIEAVKKSQTQLIHNQNRLASDIASVKRDGPTAIVKASGTGFALTGDGYLVTAYHVAQDADSLYIQTRNGDYYKANLVAYDPQADLAVLKVADETFRFSSGEIPYAFAQRKAGLGARIFTLGFPQDEVVYSEGYVSARNGYDGDSAQYRLELPAEPGVSGAPVLDAAGSIIGVVAGRNNVTTGTTYAVSTGALLRLLRSVPRTEQPKLASANRMRMLSREQQLEKLQDFTCIVRVYKP